MVPVGRAQVGVRRAGRDAGMGCCHTGWVTQSPQEFVSEHRARREGDDIKADRLSNFAWFKMEYLCEVPEYARFVDRLIRWLGGREQAG